jgi:hypothetical protein
MFLFEFNYKIKEEEEVVAAPATPAPTVAPVKKTPKTN